MITLQDFRKHTTVCCVLTQGAVEENIVFHFQIVVIYSTIWETTVGFVVFRIQSREQQISINRIG